MAELVLPSGHIALFDDADWLLVNRYRWSASVCRLTTYVRARPYSAQGRLSVFLHRLLLQPPDELDVDHRNHNGLDNHRSNLRVASDSQNQGNRVLNGNNNSGYKGVCWNRQKHKWVAYVMTDGRRRHLGYFDDSWKAAQAYNVVALAQWDDFALLNERKL